jgi:hypothetical protein
MISKPYRQLTRQIVGQFPECKWLFLKIYMVSMQTSLNQLVVGSIPTRPTILIRHSQELTQHPGIDQNRCCAIERS